MTLKSNESGQMAIPVIIPKGSLVIGIENVDWVAVTPLKHNSMNFSKW